MAPFQLAIYPNGLAANHFRSLEEAVKSARRLERVGHKITSINRDGEVYACGQLLRELLREKETDIFRGLP